MYKSVAVLGSGTMGYGFAIDFGRHVEDVRMLDISEEVLKKGLANIDISLQVLKEEGVVTDAEAKSTKSHIRTFTDLAKAVDGADIVIEALPEVLTIKHGLLSKADAAAPQKTIFITNSSSLRPTDICACLTEKRRSRALMAHYFNPPEIMPLVELLSLKETDEGIMKDIRDFYVSIGKIPVRIKKEVAGLSANRLQNAVWREILWQVENGVADVEDLDLVLTNGPALRWATTGVITMLDMTGLDIIRNILNNLNPELDNAAGAPKVLNDLVEKNNIGLKTGKGFFDYPESKRAGIKDAYIRRLARQRASRSVK
jgi:3-hydroxybutyryl-CoA dehydrogenase